MGISVIHSCGVRSGHASLACPPSGPNHAGSAPRCTTSGARSADRTGQSAARSALGWRLPVSGRPDYTSDRRLLGGCGPHPSSLWTFHPRRGWLGCGSPFAAPRRLSPYPRPPAPSSSPELRCRGAPHRCRPGAVLRGFQGVPAVWCALPGPPAWWARLAWAAPRGREATPRLSSDALFPFSLIR